jgi:hypothetical protein
MSWHFGRCFSVVFEVVIVCVPLWSLVLARVVGIMLFEPMLGLVVGVCGVLDVYVGLAVL